MINTVRWRGENKDEEVFHREIVPYLLLLGAAFIMPGVFGGILLVTGLVPDWRLLFDSASENVWARTSYWLENMGPIFFLCWIAFAGGSRTLSRHPILLNLPRASERQIKLGALACLLFVASIELLWAS